MRIDAFVAGYTGASILFKNNGEYVGGKYYTDRDIHNNVTTIEAYKAAMDNHKQEALRRSTLPYLIHLSRQADGSITAESKQLREDEVLALRLEDMQNVPINWAPLKIQLANRLPTYSNLDHVGYDLDYFASEYVQYQTRIYRTLTGEAQQEALQTLEHLIWEHVERYADEFASKVGSFLEGQGISGEFQAIKESILDLFRQRTAQYAQFVQENEDYAGIRGTADEWLFLDNMFMGEQLRLAFASQQTEVALTSSSGYSIEDLVAAGALVKETWRLGYNSWDHGFKHMSEEGFGVQLGLAGMKYAVITDVYHLSERMKSNLDTAFQNFIRNLNEQARQYQIQMRNDPFVRDKSSYALDWDEHQVLKIVASMVKMLQEDNLQEAFAEQMRQARSAYALKAQYGTTSQQARYHPYVNTWVHKNEAEMWNQFVQRLSLSTHHNLDRYLLKPVCYVDLSI